MDEIDQIINEMMGEGETDGSNIDPTDDIGDEGGNALSSEEEDLNEFGVKSVMAKSGNVEAKILAVFESVDISPLTIDIMMDDDASTEQTLVFWEVDNKSDKRVTYGNNAITYVLDNRMKINQVSDVVWAPSDIGPVWNHAPSPGSTAEVESGIKTRWGSIVDVPDSSHLATAILNSDEHNPIGLSISPENVARSSELPF